MRKLRNSALAVVTATSLLVGSTAVAVADDAATPKKDGKGSSEMAQGSSKKDGDKGGAMGGKFNVGSKKQANPNEKENGWTLPAGNYGSVSNNYNGDDNGTSKVGGDGKNTASKLGTALEAQKPISVDKFENLTKTTFGKLFLALTVATGIGFVMAASNFLTHYHLAPRF